MKEALRLLNDRRADVQATREFQKRYVNDVLERNAGNRTKTAKDLGVDPRTIFRHLERMEAAARGEAPPPEEDPT